MQTMRYDLVDLRLFVAIAESGNMSRGAADCYLAPSSASLRIKALEVALGVKLFEREARGVALTPAGLIMREHAKRCLADLEQMHAHLSPYAEGVTGQIIMLANSSAIASFLPDDLEVFLVQNPKVRIMLDEKLSHEIVSAIADRRADIGVVTWDGDHPNLSFHPYREDELVVLCKSGAAFGRAKSVAFLECLNYAFISLQSGAAINTFLTGKASAIGRRLDVRIQVSAFSAIVALVRAGAGIGIVPRSVLRATDNSGITVLRLREDWANRRLSLCVSADTERTSPYVRSMLDHLLQAGSRAQKVAKRQS
jgi:DNA-binding transcriptional LysR family regulator